MHKKTQEEKKTLVDAREHKLEKYNFRMQYSRKIDTTIKMLIVFPLGKSSKE